MARDPGARCVGYRRAPAMAPREAGLKAPTLPAQNPTRVLPGQAGKLAAGPKIAERGCRKATRWGGKPPRRAYRPSIGCARAPVAPSLALSAGLVVLGCRLGHRRKPGQTQHCRAVLGVRGTSAAATRSRGLLAWDDAGLARWLPPTLAQAERSQSVTRRCKFTSTGKRSGRDLALTAIACHLRSGSFLLLGDGRPAAGCSDSADLARHLFLGARRLAPLRAPLPGAAEAGSTRRPVLCLAGLSRNSRDFHRLATALASPGADGTRGLRPRQPRPRPVRARWRLAELLAPGRGQRRPRFHGHARSARRRRHRHLARRAARHADGACCGPAPSPPPSSTTSAR